MPISMLHMSSFFKFLGSTDLFLGAHATKMVALQKAAVRMLTHSLYHDVTYSHPMCLTRDLSVDAGLPTHQYHIHPLPQHYQHYLTSTRMHHFPRNNASTQVVRTSSTQSPHNTLSYIYSSFISKYTYIKRKQ